jgi:hypothetical protein
VTYGFLRILVHTLPCVRNTFLKHSRPHTHKWPHWEHFEAAGLPHQAQSWEGFFSLPGCCCVLLMTIMDSKTVWR